MFIITSFVTLIVALLWIGYRRPAMAVAAFMHVFTLEQIFSAYSYFFFSKSSLINIALAFVVAAAFVRSLFKKGGKRIILIPEVVIYLLLILYVMISGIWANGNSGTDRIILFLPYLATLLLVIFTLLRTRDVYGFVKGLIYFGAPLLVILAFSSHFVIGGVRVPWAYDIYGSHLRLNYLELGYTSGVVLIGAAAFKLVKYRWFDITVRILLSILAIYIMIKSGARGQTIFAMTSAVIVIALQGRSLSGRIIILGLIGIIIMTLFSEFMTDMWSDSTRWNLDQISEDGSSRLELALYGLELWSRDVFSMFFGIGHGAIGDLAGSYSHIVPLEVLAEQGLLGFGLFMWLIFRFIKKGTVYISGIHDIERSSRLVVFGIMLYSFMLLFKQGTILGNWPLFLFGLLVAGLSTLEKKKKRQSMAAKLRNNLTFGF